MSNCPCGQEIEYKECCEPFHKGDQLPSTAQKLMRARYSGFVKNQIQFIADTHIPGTEDFDIDEARQWATTSTWKGLEVVKSQKGTEADDTGIVEFKALYADKDNKDYLHHEIATFKKLEGRWFYEDGQIVGTGPIVRSTPKIGRNDPCTCGSGKKFKKCCGAA